MKDAIRVIYSAGYNTDEEQKDSVDQDNGGWYCLGTVFVPIRIYSYSGGHVDVPRNPAQRNPSQGTDAQTAQSPYSPPAIQLPTGGGAIRGMGEKFAANPVTGTGAMSVPIGVTPGRSGFGPELSLSYDSGMGNGPFGLGWNLSTPSITRKTDKGLPRYFDNVVSDEFILSGAEDLVPVLEEVNDAWRHQVLPPRLLAGQTYRIQRYRPRTEGLFARIERWTNQSDPTDSFWRSLSKGNITTWYGRTAESRIADPEQPERIFSWLICESHDDKGNAIAYTYKLEDSANIDARQLHEKNRTALSRSAHRYLKHIHYGNRIPYFPELGPNDPVDSLPTDWMFELVFDYGEHDADAPTPGDDTSWPVRQDPFSSYRAGFELRTYRLCQRILMFHHFSGEAGVGANCPVSSTDFNYSYEQTPDDRRNPIHTVLTSVTHCAYQRIDDNGYRKRTLPSVEYEYSEAHIDETVIEIDSDSLENLPEGLDGNRYQWVDLDGEGLSGILTEQGGAWYYKSNLSPVNIETDAAGQSVTRARLAALQQVHERPSLAALNSGQQQLLDLAGDGQLDLVEFDRPLPGFFERTHDAGWDLFKPFESLPNLNWSDPNLKFVDLNGDGHADILITEHEAFCWHPALAEAGFGPPESVRQAIDEEQGPRLVFADETQSIYLADFSGDGLTDLARIRNGEVCYWPNLGYGRFGKKVSMDNAPSFDTLDQFDQRRIRLADIDGSGITDILYLGTDGVQIYYNQSGNGWSAVSTLPQFPPIDNQVSVQVLDLLGTGTACLVWSSPLPGDAQRPMRYINLLSEKPHLLIASNNNLGAETRVQYAPSTKFYLQDKLAGQPWITRIPFVVHVVERVETFDHISRNRFVSRYAYHHGYFDGVEREFRGFGMVEQFDTEAFAALSDSDAFPTGDNIEADSHVPPVHTKTWFHTGVYLGRQRVSNFFAGLLDASDTGEYYREPGLPDDAAAQLLLPDTLLPAGLSVEEEREACRALKAAMLRQEVYALDGTEQAAHPYSVTEQNFSVRMLQPQLDNRHAVFFTHAREALSYHYERHPTDPRINHALTLAVDDYGNVLQAAAIGYGRRQPDPALAPADQARQAQLLMTCSEKFYTNPIEDDDHYRTPLLSEVLNYELTGLALAPDQERFSFDQMLEAVQAAVRIDYHQTAADGLHKRTLENTRSLYRRNDLTGALPLGELASLAIPFESYQLAFTPDHLTAVFADRINDAMLDDEGAYVHSEGDSNWWIPSGRVFYAPAENANSVTELAEARAHFFVPRRFQDAFGASVTVQYDAYDLAVIETVDPLDNRVTAGERSDAGPVSAMNYRVLQPELITDPNGNRSAVAFDTLGLVAGAAVMGKPTEDLGDSLVGFEADISQEQIDAFFADPRGPLAAQLLGNASQRIVYDPTRFQRLGAASPGFAATLARATHASDPVSEDGLRIQIAMAYSDGFGRVIQSKVQAEPGPPEPGGAGVERRWVGSGWTVFNNKGKPVRQYEPFFSAGHDFEFAHTQGVSPTLFYDPVGRIVATLHPNHSWEKVLFDPWRQENWDGNDTVLLDPANDADVGDYFRRLPDAEYLPTWHAAHSGSADTDEQAAATKAAAHAETPGSAHLDSLGRPFLAIANNGPEGQHETRTEQDIEGATLRVIDARGHAVMVYQVTADGAQDLPIIGYDVAGRQLFEHSMDGGDRRVLMDVAGNSIRAWDSRGHVLHTRYDVLRRSTHLFVQPEGGDERLAEMTIYGEDHPQAERNLRGQVYQHYDGAGAVTHQGFDFKGNPLQGNRRLARVYRQTVDWSVLFELTDIAAIETAAEPLLEIEVFTIESQYDALNRPIAILTPDGSVTLPGYNEANLLERLAVRVRGAETETPFVTNIDYNAKGQRERISYATRDGSHFTTTYAYEFDTFRLSKLLTERHRDGDILQDLNYSYDPAGNITAIRDHAQQTVFFSNTQVEPHCLYTYDALYRLTQAEGREHATQNNTQRDATDFVPIIGIPFVNSPEALQRYIEDYVYDEVGNILSMAHSGGADLRWKRCYQYASESNRLLATGGAGEIQNAADPCPQHYVASPTLSQRYNYDAHGNMIQMPHLPLMHWDYKDQLQATSRQVVNNGMPETTYYVYDAAGQRVRKVRERPVASGETPIRMNERIYLSGYEVYREYDGGGENITLERETLHVMDDIQRIALVETLTIEESVDLDTPTSVQRYQLSNHLGSAMLELDDQANVIAYEEYHPYGSSAYRAGRSAAEVSLKRYRYTGKEKDEETGLYYHGARYYACWLGRWTAEDPIGLRDGNNRYSYVRLSPIGLLDSTGLAAVPDPNSRFGKLLRTVGAVIGITGGDKDVPKPPVKPGPVSPAEDSDLGKSKKGSSNKDKAKPRKRETVHMDDPPDRMKGKHHNKETVFDSGDTQIHEGRELQGKKGSFLVEVPDVEGEPKRLATLPDKPRFGKKAKETVAEEAVSKLGKIIGKGGSKIVPFIGIGVGAGFALKALEEGRYVEGMLEGVGLIPITGDVVDIGVTAYEVAQVLEESLEISDALVPFTDEVKELPEAYRKKVKRRGSPGFLKPMKKPKPPTQHIIIEEPTVVTPEFVGAPLPEHLDIRNARIS